MWQRTLRNSSKKEKKICRKNRIHIVVYGWQFLSHAILPPHFHQSKSVAKRFDIIQTMGLPLLGRPEHYCRLTVLRLVRCLTYPVDNSCLTSIIVNVGVDRRTNYCFRVVCYLVIFDTPVYIHLKILFCSTSPRGPLCCVCVVSFSLPYRLHASLFPYRTAVS